MKVLTKRNIPDLLYTKWLDYDKNKRDLFEDSGRLYLKLAEVNREEV